MIQKGLRYKEPSHNSSSSSSLLPPRERRVPQGDEDNNNSNNINKSNNSGYQRPETGYNRDRRWDLRSWRNLTISRWKEGLLVQVPPRTWESISLGDTSSLESQESLTGCKAGQTQMKWWASSVELWQREQVGSLDLLVLGWNTAVTCEAGRGRGVQTTYTPGGVAHQTPRWAPIPKHFSW